MDVILKCPCGNTRTLRVPEGTTIATDAPFSCLECTGRLTATFHSRTKKRPDLRRPSPKRNPTERVDWANEATRDHIIAQTFLRGRTNLHSTTAQTYQSVAEEFFVNGKTRREIAANLGLGVDRIKQIVRDLRLSAEIFAEVTGMPERPAKITPEPPGAPYDQIDRKNTSRAYWNGILKKFGLDNPRTTPNPLWAGVYHFSLNGTTQVPDGDGGVVDALPGAMLRELVRHNICDETANPVLKNFVAQLPRLWAGHPISEPNRSPDTATIDMSALEDWQKINLLAAGYKDGEKTGVLKAGARAAVGTLSDVEGSIDAAWRRKHHRKIPATSKRAEESLSYTVQENGRTFLSPKFRCSLPVKTYESELQDPFEGRPILPVHAFWSGRTRYGSPEKAAKKKLTIQVQCSGKSWTIFHSKYGHGQILKVRGDAVCCRFIDAGRVNFRAEYITKKSGTDLTKVWALQNACSFLRNRPLAQKESAASFLVPEAAAQTATELVT